MAANLTSINNAKDQTSGMAFLSYMNSTYEVKMQYPYNWKVLEGAATVYHNQSGQLNVIAEFMLPNQSDYYDPKISATHNSVRLVVEDFRTFDNNTVSLPPHNSSKIISENLVKIANKRLGAIAISCPDFDLKMWNRSAILASKSDISGLQLREQG